MNLFNNVKVSKPKRNAFNLSHEKKLSLNMGELVPILVQEIVPGDKFKVNTEMLLRMAPMLAPMMHRVNVFTHFFFVPNRLVYDNWQTYITGGKLGLSTPTFPTISYDNTNKAQFVAGSLADYMGLPVWKDEVMNYGLDVNALPFRAYQLIYNEFYRDQTLSEPVAITKGDTVLAAEQAVLTTMRNRAWEKDYFTSALPWTQRGGQVLLPADVAYKDNADFKFNAVPTAGQAIQVHASTNPTPLKTSAGNVITEIDNIDGIDITVNNLRRAVKLQQWLEKNALGGSRYIEQLLIHFGVKVPDYRLQRPEFLGGGKQPVVISEVLSTVKETTNPQGNMSGHGLSVGNSNSFSKYFEEHGFVIGIMSVLPRTAYQQGVPRMFSKVDRYDYFWPEFANIGEQAILNKEVFYNKAGGNNDGVFGYTPRYAEYKFNASTVHGDFKDTLKFWHLGRIFSSAPALNETFVMSDPSTRIFAVETTVDHLYVQLYHDIKAIRPMPVFGNPSL